MPDDYDSLKEEFAAKWRELGAFADPAGILLDEEEQGALQPILHSLEGASHSYSDTEFFLQGGGKQIFKVRDLRTDRIIAMAKPLLKATDEEKEEFLREARLTACLQHPNIVKVYDLGLDEEGIPFFTMEFIHGDDLKQIIEKLAKGDPDYRDQYPRERLLEIFLKACDAISYAHSMGVAHLDIKPANIKVGPFGEVLVCDWGLSRILTPGFDSLATGAENRPAVSWSNRPNSDLLNTFVPKGIAKGTPGYLAPEQADGSWNVSELTDVYSLGAVLHSILSFKVPVSGATSQLVLEKTTQGVVAPISNSTRIKPVPSGLKAVVTRALSLKPEDRYGTSAELRDEIARFLLGFPTRAQKPSPLTRLEFLFKRRPAIFFTSGLSLVLVAIALAVSSFQINKSRQSAIEARNLAEENLRLYIKESERSESLDANMRSAAFALNSLENYLDAGGKEPLLDFLVQQGNLAPDERTRMATQLAMLHFVRQNFHQSVSSFQEAGTDPEENLFFKLSLKYADMKPESQRWLHPDDVKEILLSIHPRYDNEVYALAYYYLRGEQIKGSPKEMLPLAEVLLDRLNNKGIQEEATDRLFLEETSEGYSLSLSESEYTVFNLPIPVIKLNSNILRNLNLHTLDLSHSNISDIMQLRGSDIKVLNISGISRIPDVQLRRIPASLKLEKLIHSLNKTDEELRELLPGIQLVRVTSAAPAD